MIDIYIEKLDQLVALKKVKGHKVTRTESDEYNSAWMGLIAEEKCFSDRAEFYLYEGMIFTGAKPFVNWILTAENKNEALNTLFSGRLYGKDTTSTFRVLISTLAHLIMSKSPVCNIYFLIV